MEAASPGGGGFPDGIAGQVVDERSCLLALEEEDGLAVREEDVMSLERRRLGNEGRPFLEEAAGPHGAAAGAQLLL